MIKDIWNIFEGCILSGFLSGEDWIPAFAGMTDLIYSFLAVS